MFMDIVGECGRKTIVAQCVCMASNFVFIIICTKY